MVAPSSPVAADHWARRRLAVVVALLAVALAALAPSPAGAREVAPQEYEQGLAAREGVTVELARAWLDRQTRVGPARADIERALGADYGGLWLARPDGRISVGVAHDASTDAVRQVLADHGLTDDTDLVPVKLSRPELLAAQEKLRNDLKALWDSGAVSGSGISTGNTILLSVADDLTADQEATLQAALAANPASVVVGRGPRSVAVLYAAPFKDKPARRATRRCVSRRASRRRATKRRTVSSCRSTSTSRNRRARASR